MAVTTLTPIPYNGGSLNITKRDICAVHLDTNRFVTFYAQGNPHIVYGCVMTVDGLKGGVPSVTQGPQFAFSATDFRVRAWRFAPGRLLVLLGNTMRVIDIDEQNNMALKNAALNNILLSQYGLWRCNTSSTDLTLSSDLAATDIVSGPYLNVHVSQDNVALILGRYHSSSGAKILASNQAYNAGGVHRINYNEETDTLTMTGMSWVYDTTMENLVGTSTALRDTHYDVKFVAIPNSPNILAYVVAAASGSTSLRGSNTAAAPKVVGGTILTPNGEAVRRIYMTGAPTANYGSTGLPPVMALVPVSEQLILGICDAKTLVTWTPTSPTAGTWSANRVTFALDGAECVPTFAEMIDDTYFIIAYTDPMPGNTATQAEAKNAKAVDHYVRICRYVSPTFVETSPGTATYNAIPLGKSLNFDLPVLSRMDDKTYVHFSKTDVSGTNTQVTIRSIYGS